MSMKLCVMSQRGEINLIFQKFGIWLLTKIYDKMLATNSCFFLPP